MQLSWYRTSAGLAFVTITSALPSLQLLPPDHEYLRQMHSAADDRRQQHMKHLLPWMK